MSSETTPLQSVSPGVDRSVSGNPRILREREESWPVVTAVVVALISMFWAAYGLTYMAQELGDSVAKDVLSDIHTFVEENQALAGVLIGGIQGGALVIAIAVDLFMRARAQEKNRQKSYDDSYTYLQQ